VASTAREASCIKAVKIAWAGHRVSSEPKIRAQPFYYPSSYAGDSTRRVLNFQGFPRYDLVKERLATAQMKTCITGLATSKRAGKLEEVGHASEGLSEAKCQLRDGESTAEKRR